MKIENTYSTAYGDLFQMLLEYYPGNSADRVRFANTFFRVTDNASSIFNNFTGHVDTVIMDAICADLRRPICGY